MRLYLALSVTCLMAASALAEVPSTNKGRVSVAQIFDLSQRARTDATARSTLMAYLLAIGETVGLLTEQAERRGLSLGCEHGFSLSEEAAMAALRSAVPDQPAWGQTPATPIIVADIMARAGCD